ncbi:MAG: hypothetical protein QOF61_739 [Acidobacteriota bacterium]|nr:hypothetical protein [Acidobacteriota bacterium]
MPEQLTLETPSDDARPRTGTGVESPSAAPASIAFERERLKSREEIAAHYDRHAARRDAWRRRNSYYHETLAQICRAVIPPSGRVLELGSATGDLLASVSPRVGVGVDLSQRMCEIARRKYPQLQFINADAEALPFEAEFDYVIMSDLVGHLSDVWETLRGVRRVCTTETRVVVTAYNFLWQPVLTAAERLGLKMPETPQNWLGFGDLENLFYLADFHVEDAGTLLLVPARVPLVADWLNRRLPKNRFLSNFGLLNYFVLRPATEATPPVARAVSVVVPCRNEVGNIGACVERVPPLGARTEIIFVDGDSTDGTIEEIERQIEGWRGVKEIKLVHQVERAPTKQAGRDTNTRASNLMLKLGKGDAVRKGFAAASGDVLMILDADLTVPPEDLPKFYDAVSRGKGELINGTRLVYPLADQSMKSLNFLGNKIFSWLFTWLLNQPIKDTLCGTKVLSRDDYERIAANRRHFGEFDPFGDFDLLFGASRLGMRITELPVRYRRRTAGESKVRVLRHGVLLARMCAIGFWRLKAQPWLARLRRDGRAKV